MPNTPTVIIKPDAPVTLVVVDDVVDNAFWKFCEDDALAEVPTYDQMNLAPTEVIPAEITVRINGLWGWGEDGNLTTSVNYAITLPKPATLQHVVHLLLSQYHSNMQRINAATRFYFIEVITVEDGEVVINWGT